ncbi:hypothetical protein B0G71_8216 [Paraburkholderia sp. BL27I4N3]|uniref:hypothetical protein n=1 Tax=Paraburkholderia sp. BL27I4N3 TaxID=1938805 RepID=UPI000E22FCC4|nr:hypothetical protein [Paraburkholderia sp. BL27I4N3]REE06538.1 hypothetical protein B0G71_8216 [Paraburkholderia sp. BL27I4N3]
MYRNAKLVTMQLVQLKGNSYRIFAQRFANRIRQTVAVGVVLGPQLAFAGGGLDSATQGATTFKIWLYSFLGVCAACVLMWKGAECWADRAHWSEFVTMCGKVAVVGSVVGVLAPYLWNMFS